MKYTFAAACLLCAGVSINGQSIRSDYFLDLGRKSSSQSDDNLGLPPGSARGTSDDAHVGIPLAITLLPLESTDLKWGEEYAFEVLLENRGAMQITLPWSDDAELVRATQAPGTDVLRSGLVFEVWSGAGNRLASIEGASLYGTPGLVGSMLVLKPREKALIRIPVRLTASQNGYREIVNHVATGQPLVLGVALTSVDVSGRQVRSPVRVAVTINSKETTETR